MPIEDDFALKTIILLQCSQPKEKLHGMNGTMCFAKARGSFFPESLLYTWSVLSIPCTLSPAIFFSTLSWISVISHRNSKGTLAIQRASGSGFRDQETSRFRLSDSFHKFKQCIVLTRSNLRLCRPKHSIAFSLGVFLFFSRHKSGILWTVFLYRGI